MCPSQLDRAEVSMSRALIRTLLVLTFVVACFSSDKADAQSAAGSVIGASGTVTLQRGGQSVSLRIGDPVLINDTIQVPADSRLKLRMSDGSIVSLAPGTSMRIDNFAVDGSGRRASASLSVGQGLIRTITAPVDR